MNFEEKKTQLLAESFLNKCPELLIVVSAVTTVGDRIDSPEKK